MKKLYIRNMSEDDKWDYENAYFWFSHPTRINKLLCQYDLYKKILNLPGDIVELGVYKATSLIRLAGFRNLLENDYSRKIIGFDAFGKFPTADISLDSDVNFIQDFEGNGGEGLSEDQVREILNYKKFENIELVKGNILTTLKNYFESHPYTKIAMLHLDVDIKEPTKYAIDFLYDRIVPNGIIMIDDYCAVAGATEAVDAFISERGLTIHKLGHYHVPSYIKKPA